MTISSAIWIECTNVSHRQTDRQTNRQTVRQTDGQTDGHRATAKTALTHSVAR